MTLENTRDVDLDDSGGSSGTGVSGEQPAIVGNASDQQDVSTPDQTPAVVADSQPTMTLENTRDVDLDDSGGSSGTGVSGEQPAIVGNASDQQDVSTPDQTPAVVADSQPTMTLENTRDVDLDDSGSNPIPILEREAGRTDDGQKFIVDLEGQAVLVQDELSASMRALPRGLIAVALRPAPWEEMVTGKRLAAGIESILWLPVFVLAAIGAWVRRRDLAAVAFPSALVVAVLVSGAVTHGNLGTAFRHRGQILWALAVLSAVAVQHIQDRSSVETQEA